MAYFHFGFPWSLQLLAHVPGTFLLRRHFHLKIFGREHVREAETLKRRHKVGVIFAVNHSSTFDPIILLSGISPFSNLAPMFFLTRQGKEYKNGVQFKWLSLIYGELFFYMWGCVPAQAGHKNYDVILENHAKVLQAKKSLAMFPEGSNFRHRESERGNARGGTTYLAETTGALIVPVYVSGLWGVKVHDYWEKNRHASITYGKPFFIEELQPYDMSDPNHFRNVGEKILDRIYALKKV